MVLLDYSLVILGVGSQSYLKVKWEPLKIESTDFWFVWN